MLQEYKRESMYKTPTCSIDLTVCLDSIAHNSTVIVPKDVGDWFLSYINKCM